MIKYEHDAENGKRILEFQGTGREITAETILFIRLIYKAIEEDTKGGAEIFKKTIKESIADDIPFISDCDLDNKAKEAKGMAEEARKAVEDSLKELKGILEKILEEE